MSKTKGFSMPSKMMKNNLIFSEKERSIWLNPIDAIISCRLAKAKDFILEIGVYKGGWVTTILLNINDVKATNTSCVKEHTKFGFIANPIF